MSARPIIPAAALDQHLAIVGKTGAGKTNTAKLAVEQVVPEGSRVCVLDPIKSDWWGVTSSADGKRPGLPFHILGGPHAHVPLHAGAGAAIAELVASGDLPLSVIDMAEFAPGGQLQFFTDFAPKLLQRMRGVLYLVLEEAHLFAPKERSGMDKENLAIHWAKTLATAGRSKGVRLIVATQRTQALHNAVLGSCDTLIAHRLTAPADQEPVKKWLKANVGRGTYDQVASDLASLKRGTAWMCSGEAQVFERKVFPLIWTFDNSATPTDDSGVIQVRGNDVDVDALRALIGTAVEEAEANDPKKLKARIRELEQEVAAAEPAGPSEEEVQARIDEAVAQERADGDTRVAETMAAIRADALPHLEVLAPAVEGLRHVLANGWTPPAPAAAPAGRSRTAIEPLVASYPTMPPTGRTVALPPPVRPRRAGTAGAPAADLGKGERVLLTAIAQHRGGATRPQLTVLTSYKRESLRTYLGRLGGAGLIERDGERFVVTQAGVDALGDDFERLPTGDALRAHWLGKLGGGEKAILEVVCGAWPGAIEKAQIGEVTRYARESLRTYLGRLSARQLITTDRNGVRASDQLFSRVARR
ncbi:MAG: DUF87 domain-containing protein [Vicinamibacterales bacterium]